MEDKQLKKIRRFLEDVIDGRDDLLQNTEKLISAATLQVQALVNSQVSLSQKEAILTYLSKVVTLFTEFNHSLFKFVETEPMPNISELLQTCKASTNEAQSPLLQDLNDFFKTDQSESVAMCDFSVSGPKISNSQVLNDSYIRKPLDNTTLKAICLANFDNASEESEQKQSAPVVENIEGNHESSAHNIVLNNAVDTVEARVNTMQNRAETNLVNSPTFSICESETFSTVSSTAYQHPLAKFSTPTKIPEGYDSQDLEKIRENLFYLSKKMGFDSEELGEMESKFSKNAPGVSYEYEEPVKEIQVEKIAETSSNVQEPVKTVPDEVPTVQITTDCSSTVMQDSTALEKLLSVKRCDRNEEAQEEARIMPDLRLVPVEVPSVIRNDLNPDSNGAKRKNGGKEKKCKESNKENGNYEIKVMEPPGVGSVCVFSHIVSPSEFYVQLVNDASTVYSDEISEKLNARFTGSESKFRSKRESFEELGKFCIGYILGEKSDWYRLQVLDWELGCPSPDIKVKSVDYGFTCRTSYKYLRPLSKDLADIPMLAIQCHFPLLYPPGSTYSDKLTEWPPMSIDTLHDMANLHSDSDYSDFRMFEILLAVLEGESLAVDLVEYSQPDADSLRSLLLEIELATEFIEDYGEHPELGEFLEDVNELEQAENVNELVLAYDAKDEMRICRFTRSDGTCYKGKNCKLEHIILKDGYTTDKATVFHTAIRDLIFPMKGQTVQVLVTGYIDSCTYLVQMIRNPAEKDNTSVVMDRDISDLMDAMNHPKKIAKYENFKVYPAVGEVILAYPSITKYWIRAIVRDLIYDKNGALMTIDVYAVDFGDHFLVKLKDTRVMIEDFMHCPFQVIQVYLDNYQHRAGCDARKAKRFFDKHVFYHRFMIIIKSSEAPFKVRLTTFKGREIGPTLVAEGFAERRSVDIIIEDGSKLLLE